MNNQKSNQSIELTSLNCIDLTGAGVMQFLDGQLTINTKTIERDNAKLAALCNHKGRIVALFHILSIENGVRLILPKSTTETAINHIKKYSVFFKVEVQTNSSKLFGGLSSDISSIGHSEYINIAHTDLLIGFDGDSLEGSSYENNSSEGSSYNNIVNDETDDSFWYSHLASKNIAWLNQETVEHFLPHHLNLPELGAIDFKKGCFTGQEVIARMQYKGKLKQHLHRLQSQESVDLNAKSKLYQEDKAVGEVVCIISDKESGSVLLAIIKDSANLSQQFQTSPENSPILELIS